MTIADTEKSGRVYVCGDVVQKFNPVLASYALPTVSVSDGAADVF